MKLQTHLQQPSTCPFICLLFTFPRVNDGSYHLPIWLLWLHWRQWWSQPSAAPAGLPMAYLQAGLCTSSFCPHFSAVSSLTLSLICFFIIPLWLTHNRNQRKILKEQQFNVLTASSQYSPPYSPYRFSSHLGMQSWKIRSSFPPYSFS